MGLTQIIVWEDKHATSYYNASTTEAWDKSAIQILKDLTGVYGYLDPEMYKPYVTDKARELAGIDLDALPDAARSAMEKDVLSTRRRIESEERYYKRVQKQRQLALEYIEAGKSPVMLRGKGTRWEKEVPASWLILEERNGGEYEKFLLEDVYNG